MLARYATAILAGILVTLAVLFLMQTLIATAKKELDESGTRHFVDFVRAERSEAVQRKERRAEKPGEPEAPPSAPTPQASSTVEPMEMSVGTEATVMPVHGEVSISGIEMTVSDGEYLPIVKIAPAYPVSALNRGIEGWCMVEYTVTAAGTVKDVVVVEADPKGVFDKVSIEAALKFKYKPRVVNGEAIAVAGVQNIFRYSLED